MSKKILIPLAQGCEELEAVTLIDLLRRANLDVTTASLSNNPVVHCSRGTRIVADAELDSVLDQKFDLVVLPGGLPGADNLNKDPRIHHLLSETNAQGNLLGAICAAPRVLLNNENLQLKKLTAYPGSVDHLDTSNISLLDEAVVVDGNIITSRGPGTAMDFALSLIEMLLGNTARAEVEKPLVRA